MGAEPRASESGASTLPWVRRSPEVGCYLESAPNAQDPFLRRSFLIAATLVAAAIQVGRYAYRYWDDQRKLAWVEGSTRLNLSEDTQVVASEWKDGWLARTRSVLLKLPEAGFENFTDSVRARQMRGDQGWKKYGSISYNELVFDAGSLTLRVHDSGPDWVVVRVNQSTRMVLVYYYNEAE